MAATGDCKEAHQVQVLGCKQSAAQSKEQCQGSWQGCKEGCAPARGQGLAQCSCLSKEQRKACRQAANETHQR